MEEPGTVGAIGAAPPESGPWDQVLTHAFLVLSRDLDAHAAAVYLADDRGTSLLPVAIMGTPLTVFDLPARIPHNGTHVSAAAYRTGAPAYAELSTVVPDHPLQAILPGSYSTLTAPLTTGGTTFGTLTAVWTPPKSRAQLEQLQIRMSALAEQLAAALSTRQAAARLSVLPGLPPVIVPAYGETVPDDRPPWGLGTVPVSRGLSHMYQVHKLAIALNRAYRLGDVVKVAQEYIALPFGAAGCVVAVAKDGRLEVVGRSGARWLARATHHEHAEQDLPGMRALRDRAPLFLTDRAAVLAAYPDQDVGRTSAVAVLPLCGSWGTNGCLLLSFDSPQVLEGDERALLMMMTTQFCMALDRAQLNEAERALGDALQRKLLPRALPEFPEMMVAARYVSGSQAAELGGDWYDVLALPGGIGLVVGDVEGHSVDSAVIMGQLRSGLRAYATEGHSPADVLARSSELLADLDTDLHATCCFIRIDPEFGVAEIALAGHPPPLLRDPDGTVRLPDAPPNLPLAVLPGAGYVGAEVEVAPGTLLMLYTDGIGEPGSSDLVANTHRLLTTACTADPDASLHQLADSLMTSATRTSAGHQDDAALLLALYEGSPQQSAPKIDHMFVARHDLRSVGRVRSFVRDFVSGGRLAELADDLEIMASEIATNALIHADSEVEVWVREYCDRIHLEVRDVDATPPVPTSVVDDDEANATAEHGRGLTIVDALCQNWGTSPNGRGKTVWLDIGTPQQGLWHSCRTDGDGRHSSTPPNGVTALPKRPPNRNRKIWSRPDSRTSSLATGPARSQASTSPVDSSVRTTGGS
ncbi:SpoIIE family protein phosphatase [Streptomyces sp. NPDC057746]|uniref:ATP-binding SpoIIE family protein phosphatase n=2 Tax=unclassified Streptomyces TaxID=2593676 RepID=UPI0036B5CD1E